MQTTSLRCLPRKAVSWSRPTRRLLHAQQESPRKSPTPPPSSAPAQSAWRMALWAPVVYLLLTEVWGIASIDGDSMSPTLNPESHRKSAWGNAIVLLDRSKTWTHDWRIGDIVTLSSPIDPNLLITKRILALPGDMIRVRPHVHGRATSNTSSHVRIPSGHAWVEGDASAAEQAAERKREKRLSLSHSRDSREYGPVPLGLLTSRVCWVLWPPNKFGKPADRPGFETEKANALRQARASLAKSRSTAKAHPDDSSITPYTDTDEESAKPLLHGVAKRALKKRQSMEEEGDDDDEELQVALRQALNGMSRGGRLGIDRGAVL